MHVDQAIWVECSCRTPSGAKDDVDGYINLGSWLKQGRLQGCLGNRYVHTVYLLVFRIYYM